MRVVARVLNMRMRDRGTLVAYLNIQDSTVRVSSREIHYVPVTRNPDDRVISTVERSFL